MKFFAAAAVLFSTITAVNSFCCGNPLGGRECGDGTQGTPCCATGRCNAFCCACSGRCRDNFKRGLGLADPFTSADVESAFAMADTAGEGRISLPQYLSYMNVDTADAKKSQMWQDYFVKHDKNNDGFLTIDEISLH